MPTKSDVQFTIGGDNRNYQKSLREVEKMTVKTAERMQSVYKMAGAAMGALVGVGVVAAFSKISSAAISAASDMEETQGKFNVVFRGLSDDAEGWATSLQQSFAMSSAESKKYLSSIQDLIVPTGMARKEAGELSYQFVQMAADLGSFNNLPTEQVIQDIQSALQGSSETMAKYGINVKAAKVEQEIFNLGLAKSKAEITDAHKVQAIYSIALREGADAMGDMQRTSGSYANQMKQLQAGVQDATIALGQGLLSVATELVTEFNDYYRLNEDIIKQDLKVWGGRTAEAIKGIAKAALRTLELLAEFDDWLRGKQNQPTSDLLFAQQLEELTKLQNRLEKGLKRGWDENSAAVLKLKGEISSLMALMDTSQEDRANEYFATIKTGVTEAGDAAEESAGKIDELTSKPDASGKSKPCQWAKGVVKCFDGVKKSALETGKSFGSIEQSFDRFNSEHSILTKNIIDQSDQWEAAFGSSIDSMMEDMDELWGFQTTGQQETNEKVIELQELLVNDMGRIMSGFVEDVLRGEITTIGDMFESLFDSILDMFIRLVGQIAANSIVDAVGSVFGFSTGTGLSVQGLLGGGSGALSIASGASSLSGLAGGPTIGGSIGSTVSGWFGGGQVITPPYIPGAGVTLAGTAAAQSSLTAGSQLALAEGSFGSIMGGGGTVANSTAAGLAASVAPIAIPGALLAGALYGVLGATHRPVNPEVGFNNLRRYSSYFSEGDFARQQYSQQYGQGEEPIAWDEFLEEMTHSVAGHLVTMSEEASKIVSDLRETMGAEWVGMAESIRDTLPSMDAFIDAMAGHDVALQESADLHQLARDAAGGSTDALIDLQAGLEAVGMSSYAAEAAAIAMVAGIEEFNATPLDLEITSDHMDHDGVIRIPIEGTSNTREDRLAAEEAANREPAGEPDIIQSGENKSSWPKRRTAVTVELHGDLEMLGAFVTAKIREHDRARSERMRVN